MNFDLTEHSPYACFAEESLRMANRLTAYTLAIPFEHFVLSDLYTHLHAELIRARVYALLNASEEASSCHNRIKQWQIKIIKYRSRDYRLRAMS